MCGGSKSSNTSSSSKSYDQRRFTETTTNNSDDRDFSDRRNFNLKDDDVDKRAVLNDANQMMDSILINIDPSDQLLRSQVLSWERQATELLTARQFDSVAATNLLSDMLDSAHAGSIGLNQLQLGQIESWQRQINANLDFAAASLATGERLVESAGARQRSVTDRVFDLALGSIGGTTRGQIKLVAVALGGAALVIFANRGT